MPNHAPPRHLGKRGRSPHRLVIGLVALASTPSAHAYIDPGTGSILLQSLLAGIAVAIGVLRTYWHRIRTFFSSAKSETASAPDSDTVDEEAEARSEG